MTWTFDITGLPTPPEWTVDAACAEIGPDLFFPGKGGSTRDAKRICNSCEVQDECLQYALDLEAADIVNGRGSYPHGIYGGLSPRQRMALQQERGHQIAEGDDAA